MALAIQNLNRIQPKDSRAVFFTGHRIKALLGYRHEPYKPFIAQAAQQILRLYEHGYTRFITGGAQGIDQLIAWSIHEAKRLNPGAGLQNVLYLPFPGFDSRWRPTGPFGQYELQELIKCADEAYYVTPQHPQDYYLIADALDNRNKAMSDHAALCVPVLNKDENIHKLTRSGTGNAVKYAQKQKQTVRPLYYALDNDQMTIHQTIRFNA